jgi:hypothetical protein
MRALERLWSLAQRLGLQESFLHEDHEWGDERKLKLELLEKTAEKSVGKAGLKVLMHLRNGFKVTTECAS